MLATAPFDVPHLKYIPNTSGKKTPAARISLAIHKTHNISLIAREINIPQAAMIVTATLPEVTSCFSLAFGFITL